MKKLFFDIETVPAEDSELLRGIYEAKQAKAAARGREFTQTYEEYLDSTGLAGEFGRIVAIAYALDDGPVEVLWGEEADILRGFWEVAATADQFIGHNILDFDFPFIFKRSIILGIKPSKKDLSFARYRNSPIYDTMRVWDHWGRNSTGLDVLAKALGLPTSKDVMDGSQVGTYYREGRIEEICTYCKKDVALTREVYRRMNWES